MSLVLLFYLDLLMGYHASTYNILLGETMKECSYVLLLMCDIRDILASPST